MQTYLNPSLCSAISLVCTTLTPLCYVRGAIAAPALPPFTRGGISERTSLSKMEICLHSKIHFLEQHQLSLRSKGTSRRCAPPLPHRRRFSPGSASKNENHFSSKQSLPTRSLAKALFPLQFPLPKKQKTQVSLRFSYSKNDFSVLASRINISSSSSTTNSSM